MHFCLKPKEKTKLVWFWQRHSTRKDGCCLMNTFAGWLVSEMLDMVPKWATCSRIHRSTIMDSRPNGEESKTIFKIWPVSFPVQNENSVSRVCFPCGLCSHVLFTLKLVFSYYNSTRASWNEIAARIGPNKFVQKKCFLFPWIWTLFCCQSFWTFSMSSTIGRKSRRIPSSEEDDSDGCLSTELAWTLLPCLFGYFANSGCHLPILVKG